MLQIFDIKVLPFTLDPTRPIEVYGIFAVRDDVDDRRNYLFNRCRDNPVVIKPAYDSLPLMSPARGMSMAVACLVEVDIRIKVHGGDGGATQDLTVVDGCYDILCLSCVFDRYSRGRVDGESGTVLFDSIVLQHAVEATIQLRFLELPFEGFRIRMVGHTTRRKNRYVFTGAGREFDGFVGSPGELLAQRFVAAVKMNDALELSPVEEKSASGQDVGFPLVFAAAKHGSEEKTYCFRNHAVVSVKVSWSVFEC